MKKDKKNKRIFTENFSLAKSDLNIKMKTSVSESWIHHILPAATDDSDFNQERSQKPFLVIRFLTVFLFLVLFLKLYSLQILSEGEKRNVAENNRVRSSIITAPRGVIYDKYGVPIVKNIPNFDVVIVPSDLPKEGEDRSNVFKALETTISLSKDEIEKKIEEKGKNSTLPFIIKPSIERDTALILESRLSGLRGVSIYINPVREYLDDGLLSHVLGYTGRISEEEYKERIKNYEMTDFIGKTGLEFSYEEYLKGENGKERHEIDALGKVLKKLEDIEPKNGASLVLNIDFNLQKKMTEALRASMDKAKVKKGVVIAMDPRDGGILGMVDLPSYDNNLFAKGISENDYKKLLDDKDNPLIFRAISGQYPSGSTIKPFLASGALEEGIVNENTTVLSNGGIKIGEFEFPDWKKGGHGITNIRKAIAESVNTFFYAIGGGYQNLKGMGPDKMKNYLKRFGFGEKNGIDLPGEEKGSIPDPDWKEKTKGETWYLGDTYHMAIGQGDLLATPLQMLSATSTIANGGTFYKPRIVKKIMDSEGKIVKEIPAEINSKDFIQGVNLEIVRKGMRDAVTSGSGRSLNDLKIEVAGKTGTAQFSNDLSKKHAWFEAFAPYTNPEISIVVLVEEGGGGDEFAAPVAKEILKWYFEQKR